MDVATGLIVLITGLLAVQAMAMAWDEFYFHRRRGLGTFERWGHLVDSAVFAAALAIPASFAPSPLGLTVYIACALVSTFLITKDEGIHARACSAAEHWCHAVLFLMHGAILVALGVAWILEPGAALFKWLPFPVLLWCLYQHVYWNIYYAKSIKAPAAKH